MIRNAARAASLVAAGAVCALVASGCGHTAGGDTIDPRSLERELERVIGIELVAASFFERTIEVSCAPSADDGLHFSCRVDATSETEPPQSWVKTVTCRPPDGRDTPRCLTESGDALQ